MSAAVFLDSDLEPPQRLRRALYGEFIPEYALPTLPTGDAAGLRAIGEWPPLAMPDINPPNGEFLAPTFMVACA